jgi:hypothetical protein
MPLKILMLPVELTVLILNFTQIVEAELILIRQGDVGIGTTSPASNRLDVAGNARVGTKNSNSLEFYIGGSWSANDYYSIAWSNVYQTSSEIRGIQTEGPGSSRQAHLLS